jgi:hypothetical protein
MESRINLGSYFLRDLRNRFRPFTACLHQWYITEQFRLTLYTRCPWIDAQRLQEQASEHLLANAKRTR